MVQKKGRRKLYTALIVLGILLAVIALIAVVKGLSGSGKSDPYKQTSTQQQPSTAKPDTSKPSTTPSDGTANSSTSTAPKLDPATVSTINISPMSITVSYVKGVGAFEYEVLKTPNGTQYVEFRSADLIGTKCTDDQGAFASILASPTDDESATLNQKTVVDGTTYGLSLPSATCTSNPDLLAKYQKSFSDAFTLLKKM